MAFEFFAFPSERSGRGRALLGCLLAGALSLGVVPQAWSQSASPLVVGLPSLGDGDALPLAQEREIGEQIVRELYRDPDWIDDPVLTEYVDVLWKSLMAAARARGELSEELASRFAWEVLLSRDRSVNAFALPGGFFGVHLGLLSSVTSRDELASVLAHELTHVTQRHIARLLTKSQQQTPLVIGTMILAAIAASKSPQAAEALAVGGQALAVQSQLNFSRDMEREADRLGFSLMQPAGFDPEGFVRMFERLQHASRLNDNGSWPYLRSHPLTTERMADMQGRLSFQAARPATTAAHAMEDALLSARARVLAKVGPDSWQQWAKEPQVPGFDAQPSLRRAASLYAAALSSLRLRDAASAQQAVTALLPLVQNERGALRLARLLQAEVLQAQGDHGQVLQWTAQSSQRPELLVRARALVAKGQAAEAAQQLQRWIADHPRDAGAWQALSQAREGAGQTLMALRAAAEAQVMRYDYAGAIDRFKAAQDWARRAGAAADFVELSIIDTRLRQVEALLREQTPLS